MTGFRNIHFTGKLVQTSRERFEQFNRNIIMEKSFGGSAGDHDMAAPEPGNWTDKFVNDETVGRDALQTFLESASDEGLLAATSPERAEVVPDLRMASIAATPGLTARTMAFEQSNRTIPVFGGRVVVDIDANDQSLLTINGKVAPPPDVDAMARLSALQAWHRLAECPAASETPLRNVPDAPPVLTWFMDEVIERWRLVYHFKAVPLPPPAEPMPTDLPFALPKGPTACVGACLRSAVYDYFIDAQDGEICFFFSSAAALDIPVPMFGIDCLNERRTFYGLSAPQGFLLLDPIRKIETYDYAAADIAAKPPAPLPAQAIASATNDLAATRPDAVSAHYHAQLVYDFYNDVLKRDGVDDKGMKLVSAVNAYSSHHNDLAPPQWANAVWLDGKMWYGQRDGVSYAKFLDIIAHEMTHGVSETSSGLIYRRLSGALNESFSDFFGVVIANWYPNRPNPLALWNWEIGSGLGADGGPIRNFADPAVTGQPVHMDQYRQLPIDYDNGGVHIYSGIHNRAIHLLLTTGMDAGEPLFPTNELVLLLYLTLVRLTPTSNFSDSRRTLESVIRVYHASNTGVQSERLELVNECYGAVGII